MAAILAAFPASTVPCTLFAHFPSLARRLQQRAFALAGKTHHGCNAFVAGDVDDGPSQAKHGARSATGWRLTPFTALDHHHSRALSSAPARRCRRRAAAPAAARPARWRPDAQQRRLEACVRFTRHAVQRPRDVIAVEHAFT